MQPSVKTYRHTVFHLTFKTHPTILGRSDDRALKVKIRKKKSVVLVYNGERNKVPVLEFAVFYVPVPFCSDLD